MPVSLVDLIRLIMMKKMYNAREEVLGFVKKRMDNGTFIQETRKKLQEKLEVI